MDRAGAQAELDRRKERLGSISKAGNRYLRSLLVVGALSVIRRAKQVGYTRRAWLAELMARGR
jgi:transposase